MTHLKECHLQFSDDFTCEHKMDIVALWDIEDFDVIVSAERFIIQLADRQVFLLCALVIIPR